MNGLSSILKSFLIFCLVRGWQGSDTVPQYVLYLYENISISGGAPKGYRPLSRCLQACNDESTCEAVDWNKSCWFHKTTLLCNWLRFESNVRHYEMKRCSGHSVYNCPCSTGGTCVRTYTSPTQISSEECVCNLGRTGDQCSDDVECTAPTFPNASPSPVLGGYRFGSNITYTCNRGYRLSDGSGSSFTMTCSPRGTFEGERKTCNIVECTALTIPNAAPSPDTEVYRFGGNITYNCNYGYRLSDGYGSSFTLTCGPRGEFKGERKTCNIVECTALIIPNAAPSPATEVYRFGSNVTYTCNSGYRFSYGSGSSFTLTCGPRGEFEGEKKTCNRTCDLPKSDHLRRVTQRSVTFEGQTVTYTCDTGFQFNDTSTVKNLTCQADGSFDHSLPSCVPISCAFPTSKFNLNTVKGPYNYKQNVTFSCISGYNFAGYNVKEAITSQCIATDTMEPPIPDCIKRTCTLPHLNNTVARAESKDLFFMTPVEFECMKGFQFPNGNTKVTLTCDETDGFGMDSLSCTAVLPEAGTQAASTGPNIGVSVGVGVTGAMVLLSLVVIVVVFYKCRRKQMSNSNEDIDVSSNGKLSKTMYTTSNTHIDTNLYELEGECPMADRYDQSNNMRQNSNNENQTSDVQDLYAVPDKSKKTKKGKKKQNTPASYPEDAYEYVRKPAQTSFVSRQDCSSTYELAGQFQNGGYTQSIDDADDVEFVENDIYETGDIDNMGHAYVESVENDIYNSSA